MSMNLSLSNIWVEAGATVTGIGLAATAASQVIVGHGPPTTLGGWATEIVLIVTALLKVFGK
jgi:hypothetical protein